MRSFLFVPGDSTRKFDSASKTAADCLILDLEDSVAPDQKPAARAIIVDALRQLDFGPRLRILRINGLDTGMTDAARGLWFR